MGAVKGSRWTCLAPEGEPRCSASYPSSSMEHRRTYGCAFQPPPAPAPLAPLPVADSGDPGIEPADPPASASGVDGPAEDGPAMPGLVEREAIERGLIPAPAPSPAVPVAEQEGRSAEWVDGEEGRYGDPDECHPNQGPHPLYPERGTCGCGEAMYDAPPAARPSPEKPGEVVAELAARAFANSERWFPGVHDHGDDAITTHLALGLGGEAGEVLDVLKKADICGLVETCDMHAPGKHDRAALGSEMADLFTYLLNLAHHHGIDLVAEFEAKQAICAQRWDR